MPFIPFIDYLRLEKNYSPHTITAYKFLGICFGWLWVQEHKRSELFDYQKLDHIVGGWECFKSNGES